MYRRIVPTLHALLIIYMLCLNLGVVSGQTIDEIIARSSSAVPILSDGPVAPVFRTELDMKLSLDQYYTLYDKPNVFNPNNAKTFPRMKRKAESNPTKRWTNKEIPYSIDSSAFTDDEETQIHMAIKEWEDNTCLTFRKAKRSDSNFINFEDGLDCSSYIGMSNGKNPLSLAEGCRNKKTIIHEIGHAIGFFHEQNRPDRDNYVIIREENLDDPELYSNFIKYSSSQISTFDVPYDYTSIMHYGARYFSGNGKFTIQTIDRSFQELIGRSKRLSFLDIKLANLMYDCSQNCRSTVKCPKEGFMGKDCICLCPGDPVKRCDGSTTSIKSTLRPAARPTIKPTLHPTLRPTFKPTARPTQRPTFRVCTDLNLSCPSWKKSGYCQTSDYVKKNCRLSCSLCVRSFFVNKALINMIGHTSQIGHSKSLV